MTLAQDIIQDAVERLGVYAPGETISTADANRGLAELNNLVGQWLGERIPIYQLISNTFTMVPGQWGYTIGTGNAAFIVTPRPDRILEGQGQASVAIGGVTTLVDVISAVEWDALYGTPPNPDYQSTPTRLSYDPDYPFGMLRFSPTPDQAYVASFSLLRPLSAFADLATTSYTLASEVLIALALNLAAALRPYFSTVVLSPELAALAVHTKRELRFLYRQSRSMVRSDVRPAIMPPRPLLSPPNAGMPPRMPPGA